MMIESLRDDLDCHRGAPDKVPARRLATLEAAGRARRSRSPPGSSSASARTVADRIDALEAIAASHRRHGHVQEVIVQNFLPKAGTAMHAAPPCPADDFLQAIALARLILPAGDPPPGAAEPVRRLRPPARRRHRRLGRRLAGHRRPREPRAALAGPRPAARGHRGARASRSAPRLTIYPEHALDPERWLDPATRFPVLDRSDAEGLGRDDPGGGVPRADQGRRRRRHRRRGRADRPPQHGVVLRRAGRAARPRARRRAARGWHGPVGEVLEGVLLGQEVGEDEITTLFSARGAEVAAVAQVADELRRAVVGDIVTYVRNRNINYTNVCTFKCRFCGFSKGPLSLNLRGTPYLLTLEDIQERVRRGGGRRAPPRCASRAASTPTSTATTTSTSPGPCTRSRRRSTSTASPPSRSPRAPSASASRWPTTCAASWTPACKTLPGTAAEILDDPVRALLCPDKITTEEWLEAHRTAHSVGLRSNVTIMFGAIEQPRSWARHLVRTRALQKETGGFTEFVPLPVRAHGGADLPAAQGPPRARRSARRCSCTPSAASPTAAGSTTSRCPG